MNKLVNEYTDSKEEIPPDNIVSGAGGFGGKEIGGGAGINEGGDLLGVGGI